MEQEEDILLVVMADHSTPSDSALIHSGEPVHPERSSLFGHCVGPVQRPYVSFDYDSFQKNWPWLPDPGKNHD
ncbi:MAG: hypothetical protein DRG82_16040 [Deltaproteobacteria bacterium]|nr:MAG: hypothetical protein DRG82_16040 [Deltaproteobacteria bacterium]